MSRLSSAPGALRAAPLRIGKAPKYEQGRPVRQRADPEWRKWYNTKRWRDLKQEVHIRDNYTCQRTGTICAGKYPADDSPTANHIKPHRGNPALFWDINNIETVTKAVHDTLIQQEEQASLIHKGVWD